MEHEVLICPFCGAPHREAIPSGTVQVMCKYCGGTILVPRSFGGEIRRCPNHRDVLAVGLCNDCGGSFCDGCLSFYEVEHGTLHLCPNCNRIREADKTTFTLIAGLLLLLFGLFITASASSVGGALTIGILFIGFLALPIMVWGIYRRTHLPEAVTVKARNENIQREVEFRKSLGAQASVPELYSRLLDDYLRDYGPKIAYDMIQRRIDYYISAGKTRNEAIMMLAEEQGYI